MTKLSNKHEKTLAKIFATPTLASIEWRNIESLFEALEAHIEEGSGSRIHVLLNGEPATFHRPHPQKETDKGAVVSVRKFLTIAGVVPAQPDDD